MKYQPGDRVVIVDAARCHAPEELKGLSGTVVGFLRKHEKGDIYSVKVDDQNGQDLWEFYEDCIDFELSQEDVDAAIASIVGQQTPVPPMTVLDWIHENAYKYDLTRTGGDYGYGGEYVEHQEPDEEGIAKMYEDMIAAGVGLPRR